MLLEEILLDDKSTIKDAIEKLEKVRCKVVYVVSNKKLKGSVSDGDVRRFALENGNIMNSVYEIANISPRSFYKNQKEEMEYFFKSSEAYSAPIINFNDEVIGVAFRNGNVIYKTSNKISCPVVIMAGGKGTRLYPYTRILPKALIPVGDIPISELIIKSFNRIGCNEIFMVVNHKKKMLQAYFEGSENKYNVTFLEEEVPLGTGGGLSLLKGYIEEDFFFSNCDILIDADYSSMYGFHKENGNVITIIAAEYKHEISYGVIDINDSNEYIRMREKPYVNYLINTGLYIVEPKVLDFIDSDIYISFPDIITKVNDNGLKVGVYTVDEYAYMDMGQLEELDRMQKKLNL